MINVLSPKFHIISLLLIAATLWLLPACGRSGVASPGGGGPKGKQSVEDPVAITLAPVERLSVDRTVEVTGTLFADEDALISTKLSGRIISIAVDVGDAVAPGATLSQIDPTDYELDLAEHQAMAMASLAKVGLSALPEDDFDLTTLPTVEKARAEASNAEAKLSRATQLFEASPPLISEQDYADIRTTWDTARHQANVELLIARSVLAEARAQVAAVAAAEQRLADTAVKAPLIPNRTDVQYRVAERRMSVGEYVTVGAPLFRLVITDLIKFRAYAPERFVGQIAVGQKARIVTDSEAGVTEGVVARLSPTVDPQNRSFLVEIEAPNTKELLKPGTFARGSVITRSEAEVAFVPRSAVVSFAGVNRVFSVTDGKAVEHRVQLGTRRGELIEIKGGINVASVVVEGAPGLTAGTPVRVSSEELTQHPRNLDEPSSQP